MKVEIGRQYINKTWRFLVPCLRGHGSEFIKRFNAVFKLAAGIHDSLLDGSVLSNGRNIYVLIDIKYQPRMVDEFINYLEYQEYFKGSYCPDSDINSRKLMVIIEIPKQFENAYDMFLRGSYSKMYTSEELNILYSTVIDNDNLNDHQLTLKKDYDILLKSSLVIDEFVKKLNIEFNTVVSPEDFIDSEVELPLKKVQEIFNCKKNQEVFFNEKKDKLWQS